jgi:YD repeat-containing protein
VTDLLGARSSATWDAASGLPASYTDALGNTTTFTYTATTQGAFVFYDLTGVRFADGSTTSLTRDAKGNVVSLTDQSGRRWQATRNARGQIATLTNPSGGVTTFSYGPDGMIASGQLNSGDITRFESDAAS